MSGGTGPRACSALLLSVLRGYGRYAARETGRASESAECESLGSDESERGLCDEGRAEILRFSATSGCGRGCRICGCGARRAADAYDGYEGLAAAGAPAVSERGDGDVDGGVVERGAGGAPSEEPGDEVSDRSSGDREGVGVGDGDELLDRGAKSPPSVVEGVPAGGARAELWDGPGGGVVGVDGPEGGGGDGDGENEAGAGGPYDKGGH
jgi:hypothetical protein